MSNVLAITKSIIILNTYKSSEKVNINYHLYIYTCRFSLFSKVKIFHVQSFFFFAKRMHHVSVNKKKIWLLSQLLINRFFYPNMQLYQCCQIIKILVCNKIFDQLGELFHKNIIWSINCSNLVWICINWVATEFIPNNNKYNRTVQPYIYPNNIVLLICQ